MRYQTLTINNHANAHTLDLTFVSNPESNPINTEPELLRKQSNKKSKNINIEETENQGNKS